MAPNTPRFAPYRPQLGRGQRRDGETNGPKRRPGAVTAGPDPDTQPPPPRPVLAQAQPASRESAVSQAQQAVPVPPVHARAPQTEILGRAATTLPQEQRPSLRLAQVQIPRPAFDTSEYQKVDIESRPLDKRSQTQRKPQSQGVAASSASRTLPGRMQARPIQTTIANNNVDNAITPDLLAKIYFPPIFEKFGLVPFEFFVHHVRLAVPGYEGDLKRLVKAAISCVMDGQQVNAETAAQQGILSPAAVAANHLSHIMGGEADGSSWRHVMSELLRIVPGFDRLTAAESIFTVKSAMAMYSASLEAESAGAAAVEQSGDTVMGDASTACSHGSQQLSLTAETLERDHLPAALSRIAFPSIDTIHRELMSSVPAYADLPSAEARRLLEEAMELHMAAM